MLAQPPSQEVSLCANQVNTRYKTVYGVLDRDHWILLKNSFKTLELLNYFEIALDRVDSCGAPWQL